MIEVPHGHGETGVAEHALDDVRRELLAKVRRIGVPEPVRVDTLLDPSFDRQALAELAHVRIAELLTAAWGADHAEVPVPTGEAKLLTFPRPYVEHRGGRRVNRDDATLIAFPVQHRDPAVLEVDVLRVEREGFADAQTSAPHHSDQRSIAPAGGTATAGIYQPVHLIGAQHLGRELHALIRRLFAKAIGRLGHGRTVIPTTVEWLVGRRRDLGGSPTGSTDGFEGEHGLTSLLIELQKPRSTNRGIGLSAEHHNQVRPGSCGRRASWPVAGSSPLLAKDQHTGGSGMTGRSLALRLIILAFSGGGGIKWGPDA